MLLVLVPQCVEPVPVLLPQLCCLIAPLRLGHVLKQGVLDQQLDRVMHEVRRDEQTVDDSEAAGHVVAERQVKEVKRIFDPGRVLGHRASCVTICVHHRTAYSGRERS